MKTRFSALAVVFLCAASCRRGSPDEAYWSRMDALYRDAATAFSAGFESPTPQAIQQLQAMRDQMAQLQPPASAGKYHEIKLAELDSGIRVLTARRDHDSASAEQMNRKLLETRAQAYEERRRVRPEEGGGR